MGRFALIPLKHFFLFAYTYTHWSPKRYFVKNRSFFVEQLKDFHRLHDFIRDIIM